MYFAGYLRSFNPAFGPIILPGNNTQADLFVAKLSGAGQWQWAVKPVGSGDDEARVLAVDAAGNAYVAGTFESATLQLGSSTLTSQHARLANDPAPVTAYVAKLSSAGQWQWARQATSIDNTASTGLGVDAAGELHLAGAFGGANASFGTTTLPGSGSDLFVARLNAAGQWLGASKSESGYHSRINATCTDAAGQVYVAGTFSGTVTFGSTSLSSAGGQDAFVGKLDASGQWLWARSAGGDGADQATGVALGAAGNVYVTGTHESSTLTLGSTALASYSRTDVFVAKLDAGGQWLWAQRAGGSNIDAAARIAVDAAGNVDVLGQFYLAGAVGPVARTASGPGHYLAQLSSSGQWLWARSFGGPGYDVAQGLATDAARNVFVGGFFGSPTLTLGSQTLTKRGFSNAFVGKLDAAGQWQWAVAGGGGNSDGFTALATDAAGNVYAAGAFNSFNATFGATALSSVDSTDVVVAKLSGAGQWQWARQAGTTGYNLATGIAVEAGGDAYITGQYRGRGPSFGNHQLGSSGAFPDLFVAKISTGGQWQWAIRGNGSGGSTATGIVLDGTDHAYVTGGYDYGSLGLGATSLAGAYGYHETGFLARLATTVTAARTPSRGAQLAAAFPNPFGAELTVQLLPGGPVELRVTDALGRVRLRRRLAGAERRLTLPEAAQWPAGVYLLTVQQGQQQQVLKLVRQ